MLKELMNQGVDIVIDETNTTRKRRTPILELAKEHDYWVEAYVMTTSKEECIRRCEKISYEEYKLMKPIIEKMDKQWEDIDEGKEKFHAIYYV